MTTDGIQHVGGEADLIDGALRGSRSKEDGYRADEEEQEEQDELLEDEDDDDDDDEDSTVLRGEMWKKMMTPLHLLKI